VGCEEIEAGNSWKYSVGGVIQVNSGGILGFGPGGSVSAEEKT
jgi:hypothetical protein